MQRFSFSDATGAQLAACSCNLVPFLALIQIKVPNFNFFLVHEDSGFLVR